MNDSLLQEVKLAILIGINEYKNGIPQLSSAKSDVVALGSILGNDYGYTVETLFDDQATLAALESAFTGLSKRVTAQHRLIVYFAGHGIAFEANDGQDGPQGYLLPQDARRDEVASFLPMTTLHAWLKNLGRCHHLLLILDCCFAGAFRWPRTRSLLIGPVRLYRERFERYVRESAWQVLTSCAHDEEALDTVAGGQLGRRDGGAQHSPFAKALCEGLQGAADLRIGGRPADGVIVANELHLYLESRFAQLEKQTIARANTRIVQRPMLWSLAGHEKGQFIFVMPGWSSNTLEAALELNEKNNPYRGLEVFEPEHASLFFGRRAITDALFERVCAERLTVVLGCSGCGKSSLVRAGLLPRCRRESGWRILPLMRPGAKPLVALSAVGQELGGAGTSLADTLTAACQAEPMVRFLLVIDQLEELITMAVPQDEQARFFAQLTLAMERAQERLRVVMTLRVDFEPHFAGRLPALPSERLRFLVRPLNRDELREAIERPALERVLDFEPPALVAALIDEVVDMPGALPLLSMALSNMYGSFLRRSPEDRSLWPEDLGAGGVSGALGQHADQVYASLDAEHQRTLLSLMLRMVTFEGGERARRRVMRSELRYEPVQSQHMEHVLARLESARLLVSGTDAEGKQYVEPAHDTLVLSWKTLTDFINGATESLLLLRRLTQATADWEANGRNVRDLWTDNPRLEQIPTLPREHRECFNAIECLFIEESERRRRRLRNLRASLVAAIVLFFASTTLFALAAERRAVEAQGAERTQRLAAQTAREIAEQSQHRAEIAGQRAVAAQEAERTQRLAAQAAQEAERTVRLASQAAREIAEQSQYRAQIRAAAASVEANKFPTARQILLSTHPAYRGWEWAYLLAIVGPRPMHFDEIKRHSQLMKALRQIPIIREALHSARDTDAESEEEPIAEPSEKKRATLPSAIVDGGGRRGGTLTVASGQTKLLTVQTGLYGQIDSPYISDDASLIGVRIDCGETHHSDCETTGGESLRSGVVVFGLGAIPAAAVPSH